MARLSIPFLFLVACSSLPPDTHRLKPDHAPTPFSAAQIREACPAGRVSTFLIEVPLQPNVMQIFRFTKADAEGADFEVGRKGADGKPIGEARAARSTWAGFQSHASFPQVATSITEAERNTPAGRFDCWLYTVTATKDGKTEVRRLHFAKPLPGPPVRMTRDVDGQRTFSMTLIEHESGG